MSVDERRWLVLDGPIDANWVESLNMLLDDNKALGLANGDIIRMTPNLRIIFEAEDVAVCSPATVSRCNFVAFQKQEDSWKKVVKTWKKKLPRCFGVNEMEVIDNLTEHVVEPIIKFVTTECE